MADDRKTIAGWVHHLTAPDAPLTLDELNALSLLHIRDNVLEMRKAAEHTEGMVGALDVLGSGLAHRAGLPYPSSATGRAALATERQALQEGDRG